MPVQRHVPPSTHKNRIEFAYFPIEKLNTIELRDNNDLQYYVLLLDFP